MRTLVLPNAATLDADAIARRVTALFDDSVCRRERRSAHEACGFRNGPSSALGQLARLVEGGSRDRKDAR